MRILVIGADGFIGAAVAGQLAKRHEVVRAARSASVAVDYHVDLTKPDTITAVLTQAKPDTIVNCAGVVENTEQAALNPRFTTNLLEVVVASGLEVRRIVVCGSASEYGRIRPEDLPVKETLASNPVGSYAASKAEETKVAGELASKHHLPVVVVRIFNPLGPGMHAKFLVSSLIRQVREVRSGTRDVIEVSRLDSRRDYVDVRDIATGIQALIERDPHELVYNLGSGRSISNAELIDLILARAGISRPVECVETATAPEPLVAIQADISRMTDEFDWRPRYSIQDTVGEIIDATN